MLRSRMFWRLFGIYGVLMAASISYLGVVIDVRVERHFEHQIEESLHSKAILIREMVRGCQAHQAPLWPSRIEALGRQLATRITLLQADGEVLVDSDAEAADMENHAGRPEVQRARDTGLGTATRFSGTVGQSLMYVALRTDDPGGAVAVVRVALPLANVRGRLAELRP